MYVCMCVHMCVYVCMYICLYILREVVCHSLTQVVTERDIAPPTNRKQTRLIRQWQGIKQAGQSGPTNLPTSDLTRYTHIWLVQGKVVLCEF